MRLETFAGRTRANTPIGHSFPAPEDEEEFGDAVRAAVMVGESRTLQQDLAYGVRQPADVALKAMSPGINDPTTAHDAISHVGTVLADLLRRQPPARQLVGQNGQVLLVSHATTHEALVGLPFDEVRIASVAQPTVLIYVLDVLHQVEQSLVGLRGPVRCRRSAIRSSRSGRRTRRPTWRKLTATGSESPTTGASGPTPLGSQIGDLPVTALAGLG